MSEPLKLTVNYASVTKALAEAAKLLQDFEKPNRLLSIQLYGWTMRNFDSQGGLRGGWAPLKPGTVRRKARIGKSQMLVITGNLRQSFAGFYDKKQAGVGAQASRFAGGRGNYALYLNEGTENMAARPMLPTEEAARDYATRIYNLHVQTAAGKVS